ncbi:MAG: hypothetical protein ACPGVB_16590, partial [Chitinophagales bacterium]
MQKRRLSFDSLVSDLGSHFRLIADHRKGNSTIKLPNCLLGGFAMFSLKDSSLLSYTNNYTARKSNLKS